MASTVTANNLAVATSTSSHWAATIVDVRLVDNKVPVPLPNFIASKHIARNYPATVLFDDGKVWNQPVEVGDSPKSQPADGWIGVKGGMRNSFASAAPGSGSPNVFVGGKKVLCFSHKTEQNAHNSLGIITDKPGLDKLLKEYEDSLKAKQAAKPKEAKSESQGGGAGAAGQAKEPPKPAEPPPQAATPAEDCTITGVNLRDNHPKGPRRPKPVGDTAAPATIEVLGGSTIQLSATLGKQMCGKHPIWRCLAADWTATGATATFPVPGNVGSSSAGIGGGFAGLRRLFSDLPNQAPFATYAITIEDCKGIKLQRNVLAFKKRQETPFDMEVAPFQPFGDSLKKVFIKTGIDIKWSIKPPSGRLTAEGAWEEEEDGNSNHNKVYCKIGLKGSVTIFDGAGEVRYSILNLPIPEPTFQAFARTLQLLNGVAISVTGRNIIDGYFFFGAYANVSTTLSLEWKKYYQSNFGMKPGASWDLKGTITAKAGIRVEGLAEDKVGGAALVRAEGNVNISVELSSTLDIKWPPEITVKGRVPSPKLEFFLEWDLNSLFAEKPGTQGATSVWGWITSQWNEFKAEAKKKIAAALGEGLLRGRKGISLDFGWDEREFELAKYTLPVS